MNAGQLGHNRLYVEKATKLDAVTGTFIKPYRQCFSFCSVFTAHKKCSIAIEKRFHFCNIREAQRH